MLSEIGQHLPIRQLMPQVSLCFLIQHAPIALFAIAAGHNLAVAQWLFFNAVCVTRHNGYGLGCYFGVLCGDGM